MPGIKRLRAPVVYQGGKFKELTRIFEHEPNDVGTFVDVFGGGGVVALNYSARGVSTHYNDLYPPLVLMYKTLQDQAATEALQTRLDSITPSLEEHAAICRGEKGMLERLFYITRCTMGVDPHSTKIPAPRFKERTTELKTSILPPSVKLMDYVPYVSKWRITEKDFRDVLAEYKDDADAFLYCDPPYVSKTTKQYTTSFTTADLLEIYEFMKHPDTKCRVMLNVDYTGWTRETFAEFLRTAYPVTYGVKGTANIYQKYHLILTNY